VETAPAPRVFKKALRSIRLITPLERALAALTPGAAHRRALPAPYFSDWIYAMIFRI
jgi:hypothetical protein